MTSVNTKGWGPDWWQLVLIILGVAFTIGGSSQMLSAHAADIQVINKRVDRLEANGAMRDAKLAAIGQGQQDSLASLAHIQAQVDFLVLKERAR